MIIILILSIILNIVLFFALGTKHIAKIDNEMLEDAQDVIKQLEEENERLNERIAELEEQNDYLASELNAYETSDLRQDYLNTKRGEYER